MPSLPAALALICALVMIWAPRAAAQHETSADARALLVSASAADQAWGAWIAGRDRFSDLIPEIERVAVAYRDTDVWPKTMVATVAIDALIEMNASVEADWAESFLPGRPAQAMILLSRAGPSANAALLRVLRERHGLMWFAAADLLLQGQPRPTGVAASLLTPLEIRGIVFAAPTPGQAYDESDGIGSETVGDGIAPLAPDYPPVAFYHLDETPRPGAIVLASGPKSIYYIRDLATVRHEGTHTLEIDGPTTTQRLDYVYALLGPSGTSRLTGLNIETIVWTTQEALDAERARYQRQLESLYRWLMDQLRKRQWLTDAEMSALPPPTFTVAAIRK